jgi:hypothetical protein
MQPTSSISPTSSSMSPGPLIQDSAGYKSGFREFLPRLAVAIMLFVLLLVAVETLSYLMLRQQTSPSREEQSFPRSIYANKPWAAELWREWHEMESESQYQAFVVWRDPQFTSEMVNIDAEGLRRTYNTDCSPGAYTIWMFGNSALLGEGSRDWETIPSLLAKRYQESRHPVCVKNYADRGWVGTQELVQLMLALKASPAKPNLVIFYDGVPDAFLPYETTAGDVHGNYQTMRTWFVEAHALQNPGFAYLQKTNTYRELLRLATRWSRLGASPPPPTSPAAASESAQKTFDNYLKNAEIATTLAQKFGFRCAFFVQPTALIDGKPLTSEEERIRQNAERANPGIRLLLQTTYSLFRGIRQPGFFYLGDIFDSHPERLYIGFSHVTPEANEILAGAIFRDVHDPETQQPAGAK